MILAPRSITSAEFSLPLITVPGSMVSVAGARTNTRVSSVGVVSAFHVVSEVSSPETLSDGQSGAHATPGPAPVPALPADGPAPEEDASSLPQPANTPAPARMKDAIN